MDVAVAFGRVLRELRKKAGLTQEQLGHEADLRRTYVSVLELGQQTPSLATALKLANSLQVEASAMIALVERELAGSSRKRSR